MSKYKLQASFSETDRDRERQRQRQREGETDRQTQRQRYKFTFRKTDKRFTPSLRRSLSVPFGPPVPVFV